MADGKQLWGSKCRRILQVEVKKKLQATLGNVDSQARLDIAKQIAMTIAELEEDRVSEEQVAAANYDKLTGYIAVFIEQAKDVQQAWKVVEDVAAASAPEVREESTTRGRKSPPPRQPDERPHREKASAAVRLLAQQARGGRGRGSSTGSEGISTSSAGARHTKRRQDTLGQRGGGTRRSRGERRPRPRGRNGHQEPSSVHVSRAVAPIRRVNRRTREDIAQGTAAQRVGGLVDTRDRRTRVGTVSPVARKSGIKNNTSQTTRHALPNFAMGNAGVNERNGTSSDAQGDSNRIAAKVQVCQEDVRDKSLKSKIQATFSSAKPGKGKGTKEARGQSRSIRSIPLVESTNARAAAANHTSSEVAVSKEELGERASNGTFLINLHAKNGSGGVGSKFSRRERRQARIIADLKRSGITQPEEVVQLLYKRKEERNWKWSTLRTAFGEVLGALSRPRKFGHSLQWMVSSDTMKDCGHRLDVVVAQEDVKFPHTLTKKEISRAIIYGLERNWKLAVSVLVLAWASAARIGDVLKLQTQDIQATPKTLKIRFRCGKGVSQRGQAYTVWTAAGPFFNKVKCMLKIKGPCVSQRQRPTIQQQIRKMLKIGHPQAEWRSVRRGALTMLARSGCDLQTMLNFSGHRRVETLLRYLDWGWEAAVLNHAPEAQRALW